MIIDANAFVGRWPFRRLAFAGASGVGALMDRNETDLALATPIAAVFYRDCLSAMEEMLEDEGWDADRMSPVAVVNPVFPGWETDLEVMVGQMGCVAVRLIPNYHGYRLYDDEALALVSKVQGYGLPVIITIRMQDERSHHWRMVVDPVSPDEVRFLMRELPHGKYVLSNIRYPEVVQIRRELEEVEEGVWEISYKPPAFLVEQAVETFGAERILYGTRVPLQYPESILLMVREAQVSHEVKEMILAGNARRVFGFRD